MSNQPHILILMPDQLRADCMSCAGHAVIKTPNIDRIAAEGVRFTHCYTTSPICMPARASFISGRYPHNHEMWTNAGQLPPNDETLFHHLQEAGYFTAHIGKSHYYPHRANTHLREYEPYMHARGFDYVHETTGPWATTRTDSYMTDHWHQVGLLSVFREDYEKRRRAGPCAVWASPLPVDEFLDSYIGRKAIEFIESYNRDEPFCLFVGFGGPHEPWDAPGEYATMYDPSLTPPPIPAPEPCEWLTEYAKQRMLQGRIAKMSIQDVQRIRASYYGKITLIDHWIGEILAALERRNWLDDTLIVFWSDHGEMLGDHARLHKSVFYESSTRVPLIFRWRGHIPEGKICSALVELIDIYPTLLDAIGARHGRRCLGRSLWDVLQSKRNVHRDAVFSEIAAFGHRNVMICTERFKYAMDETGEGFMLYDLQSDPDEQCNLLGHPDYRDVESELRQRILQFFIEAQCIQ